MDPKNGFTFSNRVPRLIEMNEIVLNSEQELKNVVENNPCIEILAESSFRKTRYVEQKVMDELVKYHLCYEPYLSIAKRCMMNEIEVMRSLATNRFYIGFVNLGGHRAVCEIRPVRVSEMVDHEYIEKMFANYGAEMDRGIDITENYTV